MIERQIASRELELSCPKPGCPGKIRASYGEVSRGKEMWCSTCGACVRIEYTRRSQLETAVNDLGRLEQEVERAKKRLDDAVSQLLSGTEKTQPV